MPNIQRVVLGVFSGIMALTALVTLWIPETKGVSLAQIEQGCLYGEGDRGNSDVANSDETRLDETRSDETEIAKIHMSEKGYEDVRQLKETV